MVAERFYAASRPENGYPRTAYSSEADHNSGMMPISIPGGWRSPSERSDAGLFHDPGVIGISQSLSCFFAV